jgi:hypothetical protein
MVSKNEERNQQYLLFGLRSGGVQKETIPRLPVHRRPPKVVLFMSSHNYISKTRPITSRRALDFGRVLTFCFRFVWDCGRTILPSNLTSYVLG